MGKGAFAASDKGVFLNKRRRLMYRLICYNTELSLDDLCDFFLKTEDPDIELKDRKSVQYHIEILMKADYIYEKTIYNHKLYRKTLFSSKNL